MNRFFTLFLLVIVSVCCSVSFAQSRGEDYKKQAQSYLDSKEYVPNCTMPSTMNGCRYI